jgi:hypothetical protein
VRVFVERFLLFSFIECSAWIDWKIGLYSARFKHIHIEYCQLFKMWNHDYSIMISFAII